MSVFVDTETNLIPFKARIVDVAADGAARASFIGATISAITALAAQFYAARNLQWWLIAALVVLVLFVLTLTYALTRKPGELVRGARHYWIINLTGAQICWWLLMLWNIALVIITIELAVQRS